MNFYEVYQSIEDGIRDVYQSDRYQQYLKTMSRFPSYSLNNCILIFQQKPEATLVAGYQAWRKKFERNVRKGEKGIRILAPIRKKTEEDEKETIGFRTINVFDISQTAGKPLPSYMDDRLEGTVEDYEEFLEQLEQISPVPVRFDEIRNKAHGYYSKKEKEIVLRTDMTQLQTVKTLVHEIAHAHLHNEKQDRKKLSRAQKEIEAESVAYILCSHYGLDTGSYSFGYLAGFSSSAELKELKGSMERIHRTSSEMIRDLEHLRHPETESVGFGDGILRA